MKIEKTIVKLIRSVVDCAKLRPELVSIEEICTWSEIKRQKFIGKTVGIQGTKELNSKLGKQNVVEMNCLKVETEERE